MYTDNSVFIFYIALVGFVMQILNDFYYKRLKRSLFEMTHWNYVISLAFLFFSSDLGYSIISFNIYYHLLYVSSCLGMTVYFGYYLGNHHPFENSSSFVSFMQHFCIPTILLIRVLQEYDNITVIDFLILFIIMVLQYGAQWTWKIQYNEDLYAGCDLSTREGNVIYISVMSFGIATFWIVYTLKIFDVNLPDYFSVIVFVSSFLFYIIRNSVSETYLKEHPDALQWK